MNTKDNKHLVLEMWYAGRLCHCYLMLNNGIQYQAAPLLFLNLQPMSLS